MYAFTTAIKHHIHQSTATLCWIEESRNRCDPTLVFLWRASPQTVPSNIRCKSEPTSQLSKACSADSQAPALPDPWGWAAWPQQDLLISQLRSARKNPGPGFIHLGSGIDWHSYAAFSTSVLLLQTCIFILELFTSFNSSRCRNFLSCLNPEKGMSFSIGIKKPSCSCFMFKFSFVALKSESLEDSTC